MKVLVKGTGWGLALIEEYCIFEGSDHRRQLGCGHCSKTIEFSKGRTTQGSWYFNSKLSDCQVSVNVRQAQIWRRRGQEAGKRSSSGRTGQEGQAQERAQGGAEGGQGPQGQGRGRRDSLLLCPIRPCPCPCSGPCCTPPPVPPAPPAPIPAFPMDVFAQDMYDVRARRAEGNMSVLDLGDRPQGVISLHLGVS